MDNDAKAGKRKLAPLKISCTDTSCDDGLHCFRQATKKGDKHVRGGKCRECGADLVNFERVRNRDLRDTEYTFNSLRYELIRHHFWHLPIDLRAMNYARRKGRSALHITAERRIRRAVGPATPWHDGTQTPMQGNPIYYAQHATATCCRKCIEYWHGVEQKRPLSEEEIQYFTTLVNMFVDERIPQLTEAGEKVPPIHRAEGHEQHGLDGSFEA